MTDLHNSMSALTKQVIDLRIKGHSIEETAAQIGIPVVDAVAEWQSYVAGRTIMTKEEQWVLHLLRLENLLTKVNAALEWSESIEDYEVVLKLLDRVEALQSLNLSRKEEAERDANKMYYLQAEQLIGIVTATHTMMLETLGKTFAKHKIVKATRETILTDMGEGYLQKALTKIETEVEVED